MTIWDGLEHVWLAVFFVLLVRYRRAVPSPRLLYCLKCFCIRLVSFLQLPFVVHPERQAVVIYSMVRGHRQLPGMLY